MEGIVYEYNGKRYYPNFTRGLVDTVDSEYQMIMMDDIPFEEIDFFSPMLGFDIPFLYDNAVVYGVYDRSHCYSFPLEEEEEIGFFSEERNFFRWWIEFLKVDLKDLKERVQHLMEKIEVVKRKNETTSNITTDLPSLQENQGYRKKN